MSRGTGGLREWLIQRMTAVYLGLYIVLLLLLIARIPVLNYANWRALHTGSMMRVATMGAFIALAFHAWIGVRTVATDYIKCVCVRWGFLAVVLLVLMAEGLFGIELLWGIL